MQPNVLSRKMSLFYKDVFLPKGISYQSRRSAVERTYFFNYHPLLDTTLTPNDDDDSNDDTEVY